MKRGDLQKLLKEYGVHYTTYSVLGANAPDPTQVEKHTIARIAEYHAMKRIEKKIWDEIDVLNAVRAVV